ncbi:MAG: CRISPR-associated endonuclease Cas3'' [Verrucomicrobiota bacterium]|nr:CRISPR-associated endonuclease Cas3'' [Limisphaera sp.]MDW8382884.1 CRISPR-associated endonuclease Cas3'' [Verrucomicrobiota bacterium]
MTEFTCFFKHATGYDPYPYQVRLARLFRDSLRDPAVERPATSCDTPCQQPARALHVPSANRPTPHTSLLIHIPTGLGKTAAVVMAWLWNRLCGQASRVPRRLVYCLPMRTLVEQTAENVRRWLEQLRNQRSQLNLSEAASKELLWLAGDGSSQHPAHSPVILMGGEELDPARRDWDIYPEKPAILIGTQDMLLSRALNRGYGMSRYRWPIHFALLNNDCLWILDETQLMGVGLETSAQLDAFRHDGRMLTVGVCPTWWMSATLETNRLATVDHPEPSAGWPVIRLKAEDMQHPAIHGRVTAPKPLRRAPVSLSVASRETYAAVLADFVLEQHQQAGDLTLVILNRVRRAQEVYEALKRLKRADPVALIHSRFRPGDRQVHEAVLHQKGGRIVVATQAVEAGVDVSARTLITELAPWPSLVQRFGRCNRQGEFPDGQARLYWVDIETQRGDEELAWPYSSDELDRARVELMKLHDAGLRSLETATIAEPFEVRPVLRRKDLLELFDTTPDLAGHDVDISRYIRDGHDTDVHVFWRELGGKPPQPKELPPVVAELCRVSLPRFRDFVVKLQKAAQRMDGAQFIWTWNPLFEEWQPAQAVRPGAVYLLDTQAGGYSSELGWTGEVGSGAIVPRPPSSEAQDRSYGSDSASLIGAWVSLADHTEHVVAQITNLATNLALELAELLPNGNAIDLLQTAARWHDLGKAHEAFQQTLCGPETNRHTTLWAKSAHREGRSPRRFFRHELVSALAWLQVGPCDAAERDLVAWLIAAHHGKVRLSIRSLPGEEPPTDQPEARVARGVVDGDTLPPGAFSAIGLPAPLQPVSLSLEVMEMGISPRGEPSWTARMLALRERFGPFRLAWLETVFRAADARASQMEISS